MASIVTGINRGDNVLGLQPDDRMPHDWLRMVARVFASYSATPLTKSIAAYIDGLHLSVVSNNEIGISDGMAFVDDQFIGFLDSNENGIHEVESTITISTGLMLPNVEYWVVLCYTWVNVMPPMRPSFDVIDPIDFDQEHHLKLGTVVWDGSTIVIGDDKIPWMEDLLKDYGVNADQIYFNPRNITGGEHATIFNCGFDINQDYVNVSMNGLALSKATPAEFTVSGQNITLSQAAQDGDRVIVSTINS